MLVLLARSQVMGKKKWTICCLVTDSSNWGMCVSEHSKVYTRFDMRVLVGFIRAHVTSQTSGVVALEDLENMVATEFQKMEYSMTKNGGNELKTML